jgi:hypothetical protein
MAPLRLQILPQPDDETCGATCLHAMYSYYGESLSLEEVISEIPTWETGGTIAVLLGCHALGKGYKATIYTYNLHVFDPTWFHEGIDIAAKLRLQVQHKFEPKIQWASQAYLKFLSLGGELRFEELNRELLKSYLHKGIPVLTGLNATYLYRCARELNNEYDDIRGTSMGHFVILSDYDEEKGIIHIADPLNSNPFANQLYSVNVDRVMNSIMLGILTYDANLLVIEQEKENRDADIARSEQ